MKTVLSRKGFDISYGDYSSMIFENGIIVHGNFHFSGLFKRQISKLHYEIEKKKYIGGEYVSAVIACIAKYDVLVMVSNVDKAIIHNTEISYGTMQSLKRGQTINAKGIGEKTKEYMLFLKEKVSVRTFGAAEL